MSFILMVLRVLVKDARQTIILAGIGITSRTITKTVAIHSSKVGFNMSKTKNLMVEAMALASPSGKMSKRARLAAEKRFDKALFGENGLPWPKPEQPTEYESLMQWAKTLRELAERGMKPRAYLKKAKELESKALALTKGVA